MINETAPVVAKSETEIEAPPEVVWDVLTKIDDWPKWNPAVKSAALVGPVAVGSEFRWKAGPGTIRSKIQKVERPNLIAWSGRTMGIEAVDVFRLQPMDGKTGVREEESWDGLLASVLRGWMQKTLQKSLDAGLLSLKAESERRAKSRQHS